MTTEDRDPRKCTPVQIGPLWQPDECVGHPEEDTRQKGPWYYAGCPIGGSDPDPAAVYYNDLQRTGFRWFQASMQYIHCTVYGIDGWANAGLPDNEFHGNWATQMLYHREEFDNTDIHPIASRDGDAKHTPNILATTMSHLKSGNGFNYENQQILQANFQHIDGWGCIGGGGPTIKFEACQDKMVGSGVPKCTQAAWENGCNKAPGGAAGSRKCYKMLYESWQTVISHCITYGFFFPAAWSIAQGIQPIAAGTNPAGGSTDVSGYNPGRDRARARGYIINMWRCAGEGLETYERAAEDDPNAPQTSSPSHQNDNHTDFIIARTVYQFAEYVYATWFRNRVYIHLVEEAMKNPDNSLEVPGWFDWGPSGWHDPTGTADEEALQQIAQEAIARQEQASGDLDTAGYREQCFLMSQLKRITRHKIDVIDKEEIKPLPYVNLNNLHSYWDLAIADSNLEERGSLRRQQNACLELVGDTFGFLNRLTGYPGQRYLFRATPAQLSMLQPQIRLFKQVQTQEEDGSVTLKEQEIHFAGAHYDIESNPLQPTALTRVDLTEAALSNHTVRGYGTGIQSFSFTYDGSNPFGAKKSIKATLKIFANSFDELLKDRGGYRYADLALKTASPPVGSEDVCVDGSGESVQLDGNLAENLEKLRFKLRAVVGYAQVGEMGGPDGSGDKFWKWLKWGPIPDARTNTAAMKTAINNSYATLILTPTVHDFKFDQQGRVTFTINYLAYVEDFYDNDSFNIFTNIQISYNQLVRRLKWKSMAETCEADAISSLKEQEQEKVDNEKVESLQQVVHGLIERNQLRYINMSYDQLREWHNQGAFAEMDTSQRAMGRPSTDPGQDFAITNFPNDDADVMQDIIDYANSSIGGTGISRNRWTDSQVSLAMNTVEKEVLPFFFVGQMVDVLLYNIENFLERMPSLIDWDSGNLTDADKAIFEEHGGSCVIVAEQRKLRAFRKQFKDFRVVLGPIEVKDPAQEGSILYVSLSDLPVSVKFFSDWLTDQLLRKEEVVYPLPMFLNDFFNVVVRNFLNDDTCFKVPISQRVRVHQSSLTGYRDGFQTTGDHAGQRLPPGGGNRDQMGHRHHQTLPNSVSAGGLDRLTAMTVRQRKHWGMGAFGGGGSGFNEQFAEFRRVPLVVSVPGTPRSYGAGSAVGMGTPLGSSWVHRHGGTRWSGTDKYPFSTPAGAQPLINVAGRTADQRLGDRQETNYLVYYAGRTSPAEKMNGAAPTDWNAGIPHYHLGSDKGIVKSIDLKKTDAPGLKEVRFEQEGYDGLEQLREVYDAEIVTYCDPTNFPGKYIFIDPQGFAPQSAHFGDAGSNLTNFGIGGYYMIIRSTTTLGAGLAETKITAKWVAEMVTEFEGDESEEAYEINVARPTLCKGNHMNYSPLSSYMGDSNMSQRTVAIAAGDPVLDDETGVDEIYDDIGVLDLDVPIEELGSGEGGEFV